MLKRPHGIYREVLEMVIDVAKSSHPREFVALLHQEDGVIDELHFLPGTTSNEDSAYLLLHMRPIDLNICGTVHSHPGPSFRPSGADLSMFNRFGNTHIIMCMPYEMRSWQAYDQEGRRISLQIVDE